MSPTKADVAAALNNRLFNSKPPGSIHIRIHDRNRVYALSSDGPRSSWIVQSVNEKWAAHSPELDRLAYKLSNSNKHRFLWSEKARLCDFLSNDVSNQVQQRLLKNSANVVAATGNSESLKKHFSLTFSGIYPVHPEHFQFVAKPLGPGHFADKYTWEVLSKEGHPVTTFGHLPQLIQDWDSSAKDVTWLQTWKSKYPDRTIEAVIQSGHDHYVLSKIYPVWAKLGLKGKPNAMIQLNDGTTSIPLIVSNGEEKLLLGTCLSSDHWRQNYFDSENFQDIKIVRKDRLPESLAKERFSSSLPPELKRWEGSRKMADFDSRSELRRLYTCNCWQGEFRSVMWFAYISLGMNKRQ